MTYFVYILANRPHGALYIGVTNDLERRLWEHINGVGSVHARKYNILMLVYCEAFSNVTEAIEAEKRIKRWRRAWKISLIETSNPGWTDLSADWAIHTR